MFQLENVVVVGKSFNLFKITCAPVQTEVPFSKSFLNWTTFSDPSSLF